MNEQFYCILFYFILFYESGLHAQFCEFDLNIYKFTYFKRKEKKTHAEFFHDHLFYFQFMS